MAVFDETPDIRTFRMARPDDFEFSAGQFLTLRVRADGRDHVRCYSISSPPGARGHMEISVKRLGMVSGTLHATVRPGAMLSVRPPAGSFVYPSGEERPIVLIAGGVGITPLMAMIRHGVDSEPTRPITLFYSVRTEADIAFHDEIRLLDRRHDQFRAVVAITDGPARAEFFPGPISDGLISRIVSDIAHASCLVCGPPPMIEAMTRMLVSLGVPRSQVHFEIFNPAIAAGAGAPAARVAAAAAPEASFEVTFTKSRRSVQVGPADTLLEAAESCHAEIPSLCRAGVCGTCRTRVLSGDTDCRSTTLDAQDREAGFVLPCVTRVVSDCTVDA